MDIIDGTKESAIKWLDAMETDYIRQARDAVERDDMASAQHYLNEIRSIATAALEDLGLVVIAEEAISTSPIPGFPPEVDGTRAA